MSILSNCLLPLILAGCVSCLSGTPQLTDWQPAPYLPLGTPAPLHKTPLEYKSSLEAEEEGFLREQDQSVTLQTGSWRWKSFRASVSTPQLLYFPGRESHGGAWRGGPWRSMASSQPPTTETNPLNYSKSPAPSLVVMSFYLKSTFNTTLNFADTSFHFVFYKSLWILFSLQNGTLQKYWQFNVYRFI